MEETEALVVGVERCGGGKWADIKKLGFPVIAQRSAVDLKDKWRNLMRVALLPGTAAKCAPCNSQALYSTTAAVTLRSVFKDPDDHQLAGSQALLSLFLQWPTVPIVEAQWPDRHGAQKSQKSQPPFRGSLTLTIHLLTGLCYKCMQQKGSG